jgi:hypothetical protein
MQKIPQLIMSRRRCNRGEGTFRWKQFLTLAGEGRAKIRSYLKAGQNERELTLFLNEGHLDDPLTNEFVYSLLYENGNEMLGRDEKVDRIKIGVTNIQVRVVHKNPA